jgi:UDP-2,3-diacylglucosamine pyrophosphatase LpxH
MLIAATSDLHALTGNARDDFVRKYGRFLHATDRLPANAIPVLLGDGIDIQATEGDIAGPAEFYRVFWNWFAERHGIYIIGNHDEALQKCDNQQYLPIGITFCDRIILNGLYYCHGHEFDLACSKWKNLGRAAMDLANLIGRDDPAMEDFFRRRQGVGRHAHPSKYEAEAQAFVDNFHMWSDTSVCECHHHVKGIVLGHTHRAEHVEWHRADSKDPTRVYINTGSVAFGDGEAWTLIEDGKFKEVVTL